MSAALFRSRGTRPRTLAAVAAKPFLPAAGLLGLSLAWFAIRVVHGIHFMSFGDESGHLLGARALRAGDRLYRDYVDAHGPLAFMVAQGAGWLFGWKEPLASRWAICLASLLTGGCVVTSPALRGVACRLWAGALFFGLLAAPWLVQALNEVNYHVLCGLLCTLVLAWLVVPVWLGAPVARWQAAVAGVSLALMAAAAYALLPTIVLLLASAAVLLWAGPPGQRTGRVLAAAAWGCLAGVATVAAWMARYGDIVGWLVYHVIVNQLYYVNYIGFGWRSFVAGLELSADPRRLVQSGAVLALAAGALALATVRMRAPARRPAWRGAGMVLALAAIALSDVRGNAGFQDGTLLVSSMALLSLALPLLPLRLFTRLGIRTAWVTTGLLFVLLASVELVDRQAISSPFGMTRAQVEAAPLQFLKVNRQAPTYARVAQVLRPGERLLVIPYDPNFYLTAGFLPIRRFHAYLPWEADYARTPWLGRARDLCEELQARPPPAIVYDGWVVWGQYKPESYIPCLKQVLATGYVADAIPSVYIRRDRAAGAGSSDQRP